MAADDIPTINTASGLASDVLLPQVPNLPISADTLGRWTRAVTTAKPSSKEETAPPSAPAAADYSQPEEPQRQPRFGRLEGASRPAPGADQSRPPTSSRLGLEDTLSSPTLPAKPQLLSNALLADTTMANAASPPSGASGRSVASVSQGVALSAVASSGAGPAMSMPASPASLSAPLPDSRLQFGDAAVAAQGTPAHQPEALLREEVPSSGGQVGNKKAGSSLPMPDQNEVDGTRALPLSTLRGLHAHHHQSRLDAALPDSTQSESLFSPQGIAAVRADLLMPPVQAQSLVEASKANDDVSAVDGTEQLHALIESCCNRLWVNDGGVRGQQGVMLDLGRWMPGCTVEVAKAAGVLRITLRGVEGSERTRLEDELQGLGDALANKLGCQVVAAVASNKELT